MEIRKPGYLFQIIGIIENFQQEGPAVLGVLFQHQRRAGGAVVEGFGSGDHQLVAVKKSSQRMRNQSQWAVGADRGTCR